MHALSYLSAGMLLVASAAGGQTNHVALGDKEYVAMNASAALQHYEAAIAEDPKNYEAIVTMRINRDVEFTKDTIASINTSGLLGEGYIGLDAGGDLVMLKDGEHIIKTQSAVVIEKLIGQFLFDKASDAGAKK